MSTFDDTFKTIDEFTTFDVNIISDNAETLDVADLSAETVKKIIAVIEESKSE